MTGCFTEAMIRQYSRLHRTTNPSGVGTSNSDPSRRAV